MKSFKPPYLGWFGLLFILFSCNKEDTDLVQNQAPSTRISIDSIGLPDSIRLFTQVKLNWSGFDSDGYISGYRIGWASDSASAIQNMSVSTIVKKTDSTFLFNFSGASNLAQISFFVQAIDNKGLADPKPAYLRIPVKNSSPQIKFLTQGLSEADTIWSVTSFPYAFKDPDGIENVDSIFFRINGSSWVALPKNINFISIVPQDPASETESIVFIYAGENLAGSNKEPTPIPGVNIPGLKLNAKNKFYLKIKDLSGAIGLDSTRKEYYFKRKAGDLLVIDAYKESNLVSDTIYSNILSRLTSFDKIDMFVSEKNQPKFWDASFYLLCKLYGKVFWYSDIKTATDQTQLVISNASNSLNQFLRFNGKLLASVKFPNQPKLLDDDPLFSYIPIENISEVGVFRTSFANPTQNDLPYPILKIINPRLLKPPSQLVLSGFNLFNVKSGGDSLYYIPKSSISTPAFTRPGAAVACRTRNAFTGKTNLILFGMELSYLSGDYAALDKTFKIILNEEFNW